MKNKGTVVFSCQGVWNDLLGNFKNQSEKRSSGQYHIVTRIDPNESW